MSKQTYVAVCIYPAAFRTPCACLHPRGVRRGRSCRSKSAVKVIRRETKPCKHNDSESTTHVKASNDCQIKGKHAVARAGHALPDSAMPCWTCRFCIVLGWSRHDLAMTWEWYASMLHVFCMFVRSSYVCRMLIYTYVNVHSQYYVTSCKACRPYPPSG
jgi:hypothetical protein